MSTSNIKFDASEVSRSLTIATDKLKDFRLALVTDAAEYAQGEAQQRIDAAMRGGSSRLKRTGALRRSIGTKIWKSWSEVYADYPDTGVPYYAFAVEYGVQGGKRGDRRAVKFMHRARTKAAKRLKEKALQGITQLLKEARLQ